MKMEDELMKEVPWLMWIQVVVMLLLIIILYHFIVFSLGLDLSPPPLVSPPRVSASSSSSAPVPSRFHPPLQVKESQSINNATGTSSSRRRGRKEDIHEKEGDSSQINVFERSYHPCHYIGLARQAFLKCFGLEFPSKESLNETRQKKDQ